MRPAFKQGCEKQTLSARKLFLVRICYMSLMSKCRGDWGLGLCTFGVFAKREPLRSGDSRKKYVFRPQKKSEFNKFRFFQNRNLSWSPLHFDSGNIWQICSWKYLCSARRLLPADMFERCPRVCCVKITFTSLLTNLFVSTSTNSMKYLVNRIPLRIRRVRSKNSYSNFKWIWAQAGCLLKIGQ